MADIDAIFARYEGGAAPPPGDDAEDVFARYEQPAAPAPTRPAAPAPVAPVAPVAVAAPVQQPIPFEPGVGPDWQGPPLPVDYIAPPPPRRYKIVRGQLEEVAVTPEQREREYDEAEAERKWRAMRHEFLSGELKKQQAQGTLLERFAVRGEELARERKLGIEPKPRVPLLTERLSPTQADAAGMGLLQGISAGYIDEFGGFILGGTAARKGQRDFSLFDDIGRETREMRRQYGEASEAWPKTFIAGEIAGGVAGLGAGLAARPAGAAAKAAQELTRLQRVGRGAESGVKLGAIAGVGHGDVRSLEEFGTAAFTGGLGGAAAGVALPVVGRAVGAGVRKVIGDPSARVGRRALDAAIGGASKKVARDLKKFPGSAIEALKQSGIDDKIASTQPAEALKKTQQLIKVTGAKIGRAYQALDDNFTGVRTPEILGALRKVQSKLTSVEPAERRAVARLMRDIKKDHGPKGVIPMAAVNDMKSKIADRAFGGTAMHPSAAKIIEGKLAKALRSSIEKRAKQIVSSINKAGKKATPAIAEVKGAAEVLPKMNKLFGSARELEKAFETMAGKKPSKSWLKKMLDRPLTGTIGILTQGAPRAFIATLRGSKRAVDRALARRADKAIARAMADRIRIQREIDQGIIDAPPGFRPRGALAKEFGAEKAGITAEGIDLDVPEIDVDLSGLDVPTAR